MKKEEEVPLPSRKEDLEFTKLLFEITLEIITRENADFSSALHLACITIANQYKVHPNDLLLYLAGAHLSRTASWANSRSVSDLLGKAKPGS